MQMRTELTKVDGCVSEIMVEELSPLHHHERVVAGGTVLVLCDRGGHEPGAGQLLSVRSCSAGSVHS